MKNVSAAAKNMLGLESMYTIKAITSPVRITLTATLKRKSSKTIFLQSPVKGRPGESQLGRGLGDVAVVFL